MKILRSIGIVLPWLAGCLFVAIGLYKNDPVLLALRGPGNVALCAASLVVAVILLWRGCWRSRS